MGERMSIGEKDVLHVAKLAELAVPEGDLPKLVSQLRGIVDYVARLDQVPASEQAAPYIAGPEAVRLRADEVNPVPLARPPAAIAPEFIDGFFTVPKMGGQDES
jgi:aspartyl-tRNA(Asn)/glutamyl-tRNA(Gln) amidotransferase subunit C